MICHWSFDICHCSSVCCTSHRAVAGEEMTDDNDQPQMTFEIDGRLNDAALTRCCTD
jgi:hypothetical protein